MVAADYIVTLSAVALSATLMCAGCATRATRHGIDYYVQRASGAQAIECGRIQFPLAMRRVLDADQTTRIATCIEDARARQRPFFFSIGGPGIDSYVATGLVGASDGTVKRFAYDSAPCGGRHCAERFELRACPRPKAGALDPVTFCEKPPPPLSEGR